MQNEPSLIETINLDELVTNEKEPDPKSILKGAGLLAYFIQFGSIPWWHPHDEPGIKEIAAKVTQESPETFFKQIAPLLGSEEIRQRVAGTFTFAQLIQILGIEESLELKTIRKEAKSLFQSGNFKPVTVASFKRMVFTDLLGEIKLTDVKRKKKNKLKQAMLVSLIRTIPKIMQPLLEPGVKNQDLSPELILATKLAKGLKQEKIKQLIKKYGAIQSQTKITSGKLSDIKAENKNVRKAPEETFIEINNAGIVLLWPYLTMFFKETGLLSEKEFVDLACQQKAVHLLHYLVFKGKEAEEHEWALNKILCGMDISDFVPVEFEVTEAEKKECNNLLISAINNWKALKSTTPEGLRQAFLQRTGVLEDDRDGPKIKIETKGVDILLNRLPYPISIIKLPWIKGLIHVEWQ